MRREHLTQDSEVDGFHIHLYPQTTPYLGKWSGKSREVSCNGFPKPRMKKLWRSNSPEECIFTVFTQLATRRSQAWGLNYQYRKSAPAIFLHHKPIRLYLCSTYLKNTDVSMSSPTRRGWVLRTETGYYGQPSSSAGISKQPAVTNR
jgi:hypothetical protein